ncbi:uncharacterized protein PV07_07920 [Cladophialophora immunda]|uniref:Zn(2)-C6 fungal-type domain-containing protein n=1 Tax=Cladophialophora immunda TaxID=569365 RepID=A0A0D1ZJQ8_9EURO|nr:uncharacterized protein PV07_07920 [Cladophialophora immunda]KIW28241.1 hypothetical protein PV07_07920 [Cladophialophora immunda]
MFFPLAHSVSRPESPAVVQYLENAVAALEIQLSLTDVYNEHSSDDKERCLFHPPPRGASASTDPVATRFHEVPRTSVCDTGPTDTYTSIVTIARTAIEPMSTCLPEGLDKTAYGKSLTTGAELPVVLRATHQGRRTGDLTATIGGLHEVPRDVASVLVDIYIERILPQYPYFLEDDLRAQFDAVYGQTESQPPQDAYFIISLIMAFSTLTSKSQNVRKICAIAEALLRDALNHSGFLRHANVRSLQCIILLQQSGALLPHTANLWHLVGEGMKIAIGLGLHQEPDPALGLDDLALDLRRRIFWSIYAIERSLAVTSHRPFTIKDEHINVAFPSDSEDAFIHPSGIKPGGRRLKYHFINFIRFRQIQSEICAVQFFTRSLANKTYAQWTSEMEKKIGSLHDSISLMMETAPDWCSHAVCQSRLMLYRPCSYNLTPSDTQMTACFAAAVEVANACWTGSRTAHLVFVFHMVHNLFEAGTTILYLLKISPETFRALYGNNRIIELLNQISGVFTTVSERWLGALDVGEFYDDLKKVTLKSYMFADDSNFSLHDLQLLNQLDNIILRKPVEHLYQHERRQSAIYGDHGSFPSGSLDEWDKTFQEDSDYSMMAGDFWQEIADMGFNEYNIDLFPTTAASPIEEAQLQANSNLPGGEEAKAFAQWDPSSIPSAVMTERLNNAIKLLPACKICRRRRVRCDRQLPTCYNCKKADARCLYYDYVLSEDIPREYVYSLQLRLQSLLAEQDMRAASTQSPCTNKVPESGAFFPALTLQRTHSEFNAAESIGLTIAISNNELLSCTTAYFGPTNPFVRLLKESKLVQGCFPSYQPTIQRRNVPTSQIYDALGPLNAELPSHSLVLSLIRIFNASINIFYPAVTQRRLSEIYTYLSQASEHHGSSRWQIPTLYLIFAISLYLSSKEDRRLAGLSVTYFTNSITEWQASKGLSNTHNIRIRLLLCIYVLLNPTAGDIWRLLGFVCRLCLDMASTNADRDDEETQEIFALYRAVYCLECDVAIALGRPTQLPKYDFNISCFQPTSVIEKTSFYLYEYSEVRSLIHAQILSGATCQASHAAQNNCAWHINSRSKLETLRASWATELASCEEEQSSPAPDNSHTVGRETLETLGAFSESLYHSSNLLLEQAATPLTSCADGGGVFNVADSAEQFIQCCMKMHQIQVHETRRALSQTDLTAPSPSSQSPPQRDARFCFYTVSTWPLQYALFSAALMLIASPRAVAAHQDSTSSTLEDRVRRCMSFLGTLEGDRDTLSSGVSRALEAFHLSHKAGSF